MSDTAISVHVIATCTLASFLNDYHLRVDRYTSKKQPSNLHVCTTILYVQPSNLHVCITIATTLFINIQKIYRYINEIYVLFQYFLITIKYENGYHVRYSHMCIILKLKNESRAGMGLINLQTTSLSVCIF